MSTHKSDPTGPTTRVHASIMFQVSVRQSTIADSMIPVSFSCANQSSNVRFLGKELKLFGKYLELPPLHKGQYLDVRWLGGTKYSRSWSIEVATALLSPRRPMHETSHPALGTQELQSGRVYILKPKP